MASKTIKLIDGRHTIQEIIDEIFASFEDVDLKTVEDDVLEFLLELEEKKIICPLNS